MDSVILCDTNILIDFFKGNPQTIASLANIERENIALSAVTVSELFQGALNKQDLAVIVKRLSPLRVVHLNIEISHLHLELMHTYALSHHLTLPDALIAATALVMDLPLYTYNLKDFRYIKGLNLYQP